jgi:hypothetical protein
MNQVIDPEQPIFHELLILDDPPINHGYQWPYSQL